MQGGRWHRLALIATVVIAAVLVTQVAADSLSDTVLGIGRGLALAAAVVAAGSFYQAWGSARGRAIPDHVATAAALLGGAAVAAAVFSTSTGTMFGDTTLAVVGIGALAGALIATRPRTPRLGENR